MAIETGAYSGWKIPLLESTSDKEKYRFDSKRMVSYVNLQSHRDMMDCI